MTNEDRIAALEAKVAELTRRLDMLTNQNTWRGDPVYVGPVPTTYDPFIRPIPTIAVPQVTPAPARYDPPYPDGTWC